MTSINMSTANGSSRIRFRQNTVDGRVPEIAGRQSCRLREILEGLETIPASLDENRRKLRDFYQTAMDEDSIEKQGRNRSLRCSKRLTTSKRPMISDGRRPAACRRAFRRCSVSGSTRTRSKAIATPCISGKAAWGCPTGTTTWANRTTRSAYESCIVNMSPRCSACWRFACGRIGRRRYRAANRNQLAEKSRTPVQLRDREAQYNMQTLAELKTLVPNLDWGLYLAAIDVQPTRIRNRRRAGISSSESTRCVHSVSIGDWRTYFAGTWSTRWRRT